MKFPADVLPYCVRPRATAGMVSARTQGTCDACGGLGPFMFKPIITDTLARQWKLDADEQRAFSARESMFCAFCGCSYRLRLLARAIRLWRGSTAASLEESIAGGDFDGLRVAEINSCGVLHATLAAIPGLVYSEYGSKDPVVPDENLLQLTYPDEAFDLVLTSDTLEHVPDFDKALAETYRILRPGGAHIMTVPVVFGRSTKQKVTIDAKGQLIYREEPSFHGSGEPDYLVWTEFGTDFIRAVETAGFSARYYFANLLNAKDPSGVIVAIKPKRRGRPHDDMPLAIEADGRLDATTARALRKILGSNEEPRRLPVEPTDVQTAWQVKKVSDLRHKLDLTGEHAANLQSQLDGSIAFIRKLERDLLRLESELRAINDSSLGKLTRRLRRLQKLMR